LKGGGFSSLFGGGSSKYEEAGEMFTRAANSFKMAKNPAMAANSYCKAAECQIKAGSKHEAAMSYVNASNCIKKTNIAEAQQHLKMAVDLFTDEGRFAIAAKHQKEIGEFLEQEMDFAGAIEAFQVAADFFEGENSSSQANQCLLKVAQYSAQLGNYTKAIEIYEQTAKTALESNLLKWGAKDSFMKAALCFMANGDAIGARNALEKYTDMDASFSSTREYKFCQELLTAIDANDTEAFTSAVVEFNSVTPLDQWKTSILLKIKTALKEGEGSIL